MRLILKDQLTSAPELQGPVGTYHLYAAQTHTLGRPRRCVLTASGLDIAAHDLNAMQCADSLQAGGQLGHACQRDRAVLLHCARALVCCLCMCSRPLMSARALYCLGFIKARTQQAFDRTWSACKPSEYSIPQS